MWPIVAYLLLGLYYFFEYFLAILLLLINLWRSGDQCQLESPAKNKKGPQEHDERG